MRELSLEESRPPTFTCENWKPPGSPSPAAAPVVRRRRSSPSGNRARLVPASAFCRSTTPCPVSATPPLPRQAPAPNGKTSGHGCGHNLLGAGCTGAAIALKTIMEQDGISGLVRVYGCAAEETTGAKVFMARDGLFDDLDACLAWHSAPVAAVGFVRTAAVNNIRVEFFGKTAHAGIDPWHGRSALDALELFCHGLNLMREHVEPTARIHYVVEAGGETPNVVPDYARLALFIRDVDRTRVEATTQWARELADGAALGTQTRAKFTLAFGLYDLLPNTPLVERLRASASGGGAGMDRRRADIRPGMPAQLWRPRARPCSPAVADHSRSGGGRLDRCR